MRRGQRVGLRPSEVATVRSAVLIHAGESGSSIKDLAARCQLNPSALYDFLHHRNDSIRVIRAVVDHLPLNLTLDIRIRSTTP